MASSSYRSEVGSRAEAEEPPAADGSRSVYMGSACIMERSSGPCWSSTYIKKVPAVISKTRRDTM